MFGTLPDKDYICQVVGGSNDTMHRGAVRVKILGLTNEFEDDDQPYVYPALTSGLQQVPQIGYYLRVRFMDGDVHCGYYYGMSATPNYLPGDYSEYYPDVAVANLGEDGFFYTHNRKTHITNIENPGNNTTLVWDASGFVTYEAATAADSGMGAKEGSGENVQHVLTEGTIDIFTCMPVGHNRKMSGIGQGSEYLGVSHISQATIDAFRKGDAKEPDEPPADTVTDADIPTMDIIDADGDVVRTVQLDSTDNMISRTGKQVKRIIVCHSEGECFPIMAEKFISTTSNAHYLVGRADGDPEILSDVDGNKSALRNTGFYQFIELANDCGMFGSSTIDGQKANVDAVVIMLIGSATGDFTSFQREIVDKLVVHIRTTYKNKDIPVYVPDDFDIPSLTQSMKNFSVDGY